MKKLICEYIMAGFSKPACLVRSHHKKYRPLSKNNISPNSVLKNSKYNYINKMYRKYYFINIEIVNKTIKMSFKLRDNLWNWKKVKIDNYLKNTLQN